MPTAYEDFDSFKIMKSTSNLIREFPKQPEILLFSYSEQQ